MSDSARRVPTLAAGSRPRFAVVRRFAAVLAVCSCALIAADARFADLAPVTPVQAAAAPTPTRVGSFIAGTFNDASGHSAQSHLVYAPNAGVWWLFTLSSEHDAVDDHTVRSYYSSGPNLASTTWTAAAPSPHLANAGFATDAIFAGGRSLGVAVVNIGGADYAHLFASAAFDGQVASNGHVRARLGANAIEWGSWDNPGSPNAASQWQGPATAGNPSAASTYSSWGNVVGISTGGFVHHSSVTMDEEVDCNAGRSINADIAAAWTNGFGVNAVGASPPNTTAVIDKSMTFECKALAFAPLASDVMLAVYSNGAVAQPYLSNLRFQKSGASGTWTTVAAGGGNGNVFSSDATIDANDWALVPVNTDVIFAFRRDGFGAGVDGATYVAASNVWRSIAAAPPPFAPGQVPKAGAGLFAATDGTSVWLFCINSDAANSILYTVFNGIGWAAWTTVPGTDQGTHSRNFISGYPRAVNGQVGVIWTEGAGTFDVVTAALATDTTLPSVTLTAPSAGATVSGATVTVSAAASDNVGVAGVQFMLDGTRLGPELTSSPYAMTWNTSVAANGPHTLTVIARDAANNVATAAPINVVVNNPPPPPTGSPAYGGTPATIPGTFEAENFDEGGQSLAYFDTTTGNAGGVYRSTDVDLESTSDAGGGYDVMKTRAGEWVTYSVSVTAAGTYVLDARVANIGTGGRFHVEIDGVDKTGPVAVPDTGGWQVWRTISIASIAITAGPHVVRVSLDVAGTSNGVGNYNWFRLSAASPPPPPPPPPPANTPFGGTAVQLPGLVEAENFDQGGQSIAYSDTTAGNAGNVYRATDVDLENSTDAGGGYDVMKTRPGEWLKYTVNVVTAGTYPLAIRVANIGTGGAFHVEVDGVNVTGAIALPDTGGWQTWQTLTTAGVAFTAGSHVLRLSMDSAGTSGGVGNFNWLRVGP